MSTIKVCPAKYEYYGRQLPVLRACIDGELVGEDFYPFDAASQVIYNGICPECYASCGIPACGPPDFKVVQKHNRVYWLCNIEYARLESLAAAKQYNIVFDAAYYERQLGSSAKELPEFQAADLELVWESIPKYPRQQGLFTLPEIEQDSQGRAMLELLAAANFWEDAKLVNTPEKSVVFQVGIDLPKTPILELEWGCDAGCYQLRIPIKSLSDCWLTSNSIQRYGEQYLGQLLQTA